MYKHVFRMRQILLIKPSNSTSGTQTSKPAQASPSSSQPNTKPPAASGSSAKLATLRGLGYLLQADDGHG